MPGTVLLLHVDRCVAMDAEKSVVDRVMMNWQVTNDLVMDRPSAPNVAAKAAFPQSVASNQMIPHGAMMGNAGVSHTVMMQNDMPISP